MVNNHRYKIIALLILISINLPVSAQEKQPANSKEPIAPKDPVVSIEPAKSKKREVPKGPVKSKEIAAEFPCNAEATVFLESVLQEVHIITTNEKKVRLVTTVYYQGGLEITNEAWLKILGLRISGTMENVVVKSGDFGSGRPGTKESKLSFPYPGEAKKLSPTGIAVLDSAGNWINKKSNIRRNIILYIPAHAKADIESRYGGITLENNMGEVTIRINSANLTMKDVDVCHVNSNYARIYADSINNMKAEVKNGSFSAKNIGHLEITSRNSTIEITGIQKLDILSEADQYEIEDAGVIAGIKSYGDFRVTSLKTSFDITGKSSNVKIRIIEPTVSLVKIDDQYADLRLPVGNLKNYTVSFEGGSTNTYASFEKTNVTDHSFNAASGTGKPTTFNLKCNNCTVDFK